MTHTLIVPAMYNLCLMQPEFAARDLSAWRIGGYGGAPMPTATIARLAETPARPQADECLRRDRDDLACRGPDAACGDAARHADSVGQRGPCDEVARDGRAGREVPPGESAKSGSAGRRSCPAIGTIRRRRAGISSRASGARATSARSTSTGYVRVLDRKKDMINRGGYKVYTAEVENVLAAHPAVVECAVVANPCPILGERVHAFVSPEGRPRRDVLRAFCAERLADYKVPESFTSRPTRFRATPTARS